ncbi:MAG TPA: polymer-forming cytoskeletal protein [Xanthobacteraceae bacterium]
MAAIEQPAVAQAGEAETISTIGADMAIAGGIICAAAVRIFGRIEGELSGADVLIGAGARIRGTLAGTDVLIEEGAQLEGNVRGHEVTVRGSIKGTIRAAEVKLLGRATVEGDIFHQRLSMEEETRFEGTSRPLASV